jgi:hypothetical protein
MKNDSTGTSVRFDSLYPVPFHEDVLVIASHDGEPHVVMKTLVENMGLTWQPQHAKLTDKFASTITMIVTVGEDGKQREMVGLPLRKLPGWLYSINPSKVAPELRDKIVRYQEECDEVLWKYWTTGFVGRPGGTPTFDQIIKAHNIRIRLLKNLSKETAAALREAIHDQLAVVSKFLGLPVPPLDGIGRTVAQPELPGV